jgi:uncharacterized OB-fold protein
MPTSETRPFWDAARRGELCLPRCSRCAQLLYPPPPRCPSCLDSVLQWERLSGWARLLSWTRIHLETIPGVPPPFIVAEAEPVEQPGLVLVAHAVGIDEPAAGLVVEITFTTADDGTAFPEFRPARNAGQPGSVTVAVDTRSLP